jgi:hypothetical protein
MKVPSRIFKARLVIIIISISLAVAPLAVHAQTHAAPQSGPTLNAEQKLYERAWHACIQKYNQQKTPRSQFNSFTRRCMSDQGITKPVAIPRPAPPKPLQPVSK